MVAMSQALEPSFYNLDYISAVSRKIGHAVEKKKSHSAGGKERPCSGNAFFPVFSEAKKSKYAPGLSGHASKFRKTMPEHIVERTCKDCNQHYSRGHSVGITVLLVQLVVVTTRWYVACPNVSL